MSDHPDRPSIDSRADTGEPAETTARSEPTRTEPAATAPSVKADAAMGTADTPTETAASNKPLPAAKAHGQNYRALALALTATLVLVLALVGTAPLWAPLLPWGSARFAVDPTIVERLDAHEQQIRLVQQQIAAATGALPKLEQRVGALEKPVTPSPEVSETQQRIAAVSGEISDLTSRLERLANAVQARAGDVSALTTRFDKIGETQQTQIAELAAKLEPLQQSSHTQQSAITELGNRVQAFEKTARSRASDLTDIGVTLASLQIRNAIDAGRPFSAEYETLSSLVKARPEIAAAAAPLAAVAPTGATTRAKLARELRVLQQKVDAASGAGPTNMDGWTGSVLGRLRSLVKIRRADRAEPNKEAEAAITVAEQALAGGDLARAVAAVEMLQEPTAASAVDWLRQARERLVVEDALGRLEALLTARLGNSGAISGTPG